MKQVEFFFDVVCPYAYIASQQIEAIAQRANAQIHWIPVLLGGIYKSLNSAQYPSSNWNASKQRQGLKDLLHEAQRKNISLNYPKSHPQKTVNAMRLLCACPSEKIANLAHRLYEAYWVKSLELNDELLNKIALEFNLSVDVFSQEDSKQKLFRNTEKAVKNGVFGVPSMLVDGELWWGQDRLHFVEQALGKKPIIEPLPQKNTAKKLLFFHDFASPFSYLASTQIERLAQKYGADVEFKPILLGGLFRKLGTPMVPIFVMSPSKQKYFLKDAKDWAKWWNVPFEMPQCFPVNTIKALRLSLVYPQLIEKLYHALWAQGLDISKENVLSDILKDSNINPQEAFTTIQTPQVKQELFDNQDLALSKGVFGVPSMLVKDNLWWGQDRLFAVAQALTSP